MKKYLIGLVLGLASLLTVRGADNCGCSCCKGKEVCCCNEGKTPKAGEAAKTWPLKGVIKEVLQKEHGLMVKHEAIEGVMPAMTMLLQVEAQVLSEAKVGQSVTGKLRQKGGDWHLDDVVLGKTE
jgi:Cu/Ag efflux protein CusF